MGCGYGKGNINRAEGTYLTALQRGEDSRGLYWENEHPPTVLA
jgi:hypothetical protein